MSTRSMWLSVALAWFAACAPLGAAVNVGDKPELEFKPVGGNETISLATYKGKLIVVDFWATWCGPCMAEAGHMTKLNEQYAPKGLQIIGISLDQDQAEMKRVVTEKGFNWPQFFDGQGWKNRFAVAWGVTGIPCTFLIGPEGTVLWSGHPGQIDQPLEQAFKEHPPQLVDPKALADAKALLDQVEAALAKNDTKAAAGLMAKVPAAAAKDGPFAARQEQASKHLAEAAKGMLAEVDPLIEQKRYIEAIGRLKEIIAALGNLPASADVREKLASLSNLPEARAQIDSADKAAKAAEALATAQKLQADKKDELAYPRFKEIVRLYPQAPAAQAAGEAVAAYERDKEFMKRITDSSAGAKAKGMLGMAQSYKAAGKLEQARQKFQEVIDQFPGTSYAATAADAIKSLSN